MTANILSIVKGENGSPGKIQGSIEGEPTIGIIDKNTNYGIYGYLKDVGSLFIEKSNVMQVALRNEVELGDATMISTLENRRNKRI